jgi:hypothetical protein
MKRLIKNIKFDKTSFELLAIAISFTGLFASIFNISSGTEYYTILGHDLKHLKVDTINSYMSNWFLIYAILGVFLQLWVKVFDIGDNNRIMTNINYAIFVIIFIIFSVFIALLGAQVSSNLAKSNFKKEIVADYVTEFEEFDFLLSHNFLKPNELVIDDEKEKLILKEKNKLNMEEELKYIEELIEIKNKVNKNTQTRLNLIKEMLNFEGYKKRIKAPP